MFFKLLLFASLSFFLLQSCIFFLKTAHELISFGRPYEIQPHNKASMLLPSIDSSSIGHFPKGKKVTGQPPKQQLNFDPDMICSMDIYTMVVSGRSSVLVIIKALTQVIEKNRSDPIELLVAFLQFELVLMYLIDKDQRAELKFAIAARNTVCFIPESIPLFYKVSKLIRVPLSLSSSLASNKELSKLSIQFDPVPDSLTFCDIIEAYQVLARDVLVYNLQVYNNLKTLPLILLSERANEIVCAKFHDRWLLAVADSITMFPKIARVKFLHHVLFAPIIRKASIAQLLTLCDPKEKVVAFQTDLSNLPRDISAYIPLVEILSPENLFILLYAVFDKNRTLVGITLDFDNFNTLNDIFKYFTPKKYSDASILGESLALGFIKGLNREQKFVEQFSQELLDFLLNPVFLPTNPSPLKKFKKVVPKTLTDVFAKEVHSNFWVLLNEIFGKDLITIPKVLKSIQLFFHTPAVVFERTMISTEVNTDFLNHSFSNSNLLDILLIAVPGKENDQETVTFKKCNSNADYFDFAPKDIGLLAKVLYTVVTTGKYMERLKIDFLKANFFQEIEISQYFPFLQCPEFKEKISPYYVDETYFSINDLLSIYLYHLRSLVNRISLLATKYKFHLQTTPQFDFVERRLSKFDYLSPKFVFSSIRDKDGSKFPNHKIIFEFVEKNLFMLHGIDLNSLMCFIETELSSDDDFSVILFKDFVYTCAVFTRNKELSAIISVFESKIASYINITRKSKRFGHLHKRIVEESYSVIQNNLKSIKGIYKDRFYIMTAIVICGKKLLTESDFDFIIGACGRKDELLTPLFEQIFFNLIKCLPSAGALYLLDRLTLHSIYTLVIFLETDDLERIIGQAFKSNDHFMALALNLNSAFFDEYYRLGGNGCKNREEEKELMQEIIINNQLSEKHFLRISGSFDLTFLSPGTCNSEIKPDLNPKAVFIYETCPKKKVVTEPCKEEISIHPPPMEIPIEVAPLPKVNILPKKPSAEKIVVGPKETLNNKFECYSNGHCYFNLKDISEDQLEMLFKNLYRNFPFYYDHKEFTNLKRVFDKFVQSGSEKSKEIAKYFPMGISKAIDFWEVKQVKEIKLHILKDRMQVMTLNESEIKSFAMGRLKSLIKYSTPKNSMPLKGKKMFIKVQQGGKKSPFIDNGVLFAPKLEKDSLIESIYKVTLIEKEELLPKRETEPVIVQPPKTYLDILENPEIVVITSENFESKKEKFYDAIDTCVKYSVDFEMTGLFRREAIKTTTSAEQIPRGVDENFIVEFGAAFLFEDGQVKTFLFRTAPHGILTEEMFVPKTYSFLCDHGFKLSKYNHGKALKTEKQTCWPLFELFKKIRVEVYYYSGYGDLLHWLDSMNDSDLKHIYNYNLTIPETEMLFSQNNQFYDLKMLQEAFSKAFDIEFKDLAEFSRWILLQEPDLDEESKSRIDAIKNYPLHNAALDSLLTLIVSERIRKIGVFISPTGKKLDVNDLAEALKNRLWIHRNDGLYELIDAKLIEANWV